MSFTVKESSPVLLLLHELSGSFPDVTKLTCAEFTSESHDP